MKRLITRVKDVLDMIKPYLKLAAAGAWDIGVEIMA